MRENAPATVGRVDNLQPLKGEEVSAIFTLVDGIGVGTSMPQKLAAPKYASAVLLGVAAQSERDKYAAHSRQLPGRLVSTKLGD